MYALAVSRGGLSSLLGRCTRYVCVHACVWFVQVPARGAWMFAEMLINFCFGKLLHYPYVLFIGKVMPKNFSDEHKLF
jgi:hypothetical protein